MDSANSTSEEVKLSFPSDCTVKNMKMMVASAFSDFVVMVVNKEGRLVDEETQLSNCGEVYISFAFKRVDVSKETTGHSSKDFTNLTVEEVKICLPSGCAVKNLKMMVFPIMVVKKEGKLVDEETQLGDYLELILSFEFRPGKQPVKETPRVEDQDKVQLASRNASKHSKKELASRNASKDSKKEWDRGETWALLKGTLQFGYASKAKWSYVLNKYKVIFSANRRSTTMLGLRLRDLKRSYNKSSVEKSLPPEWLGLAFDLLKIIESRGSKKKINKKRWDQETKKLRKGNHQNIVDTMFKEIEYEDGKNEGAEDAEDASKRKWLPSEIWALLKGIVRFGHAGRTRWNDILEKYKVIFSENRRSAETFGAVLEDIGGRPGDCIPPLWRELGSEMRAAVGISIDTETWKSQVEKIKSMRSGRYCDIINLMSREIQFEDDIKDGDAAEEDTVIVEIEDEDDAAIEVIEVEDEAAGTEGTGTEDAPLGAKWDADLEAYLMSYTKDPSND